MPYRVININDYVNRQGKVSNNQNGDLYSYPDQYKLFAEAG